MSTNKHIDFFEFALLCIAVVMIGGAITWETLAPRKEVASPSRRFTLSQRAARQRILTPPKISDTEYLEYRNRQLGEKFGPVVPK